MKNLVVHVENQELYVEAIQRSNDKFSALQLERVPVASHAFMMRPPLEDRSRLMLKVRDWGRQFIKKTVGRKMTERIRHQFAQFEALRPRLVQTVVEKVAPAPKETAVEKQTPIPPTVREKLREGLSQPVEEMAEKLRQKRKEAVRQAPPVQRPKQTPHYAPTVTRPQPRHGYRM